MNQTPALLALAALPLLVGLVLWTYGLMVSKRSGLGVLLALASICLPAFVLAQAAPIYLEDASRLLYFVRPWIAVGDLNVPLGFRLDSLGAVVLALGAVLGLSTVVAMATDDEVRPFARVATAFGGLCLVAIGEHVAWLAVGWVALGLAAAPREDSAAWRRGEALSLLGVGLACALMQSLGITSLDGLRTASLAKLGFGEFAGVRMVELLALAWFFAALGRAAALGHGGAGRGEAFAVGLAGMMGPALLAARLGRVLAVTPSALVIVGAASSLAALVAFRRRRSTPEAAWILAAVAGVGICVAFGHLLAALAVGVGTALAWTFAALDPGRESRSLVRRVVLGGLWPAPAGVALAWTAQAALAWQSSASVLLNVVGVLACVLIGVTMGHAAQAVRSSEGGELTLRRAGSWIVLGLALAWAVSCSAAWSASSWWTSNLFDGVREAYGLGGEFALAPLESALDEERMLGFTWRALAIGISLATGLWATRALAQGGVRSWAGTGRLRLGIAPAGARVGLAGVRAKGVVEGVVRTLGGEFTRGLFGLWRGPAAVLLGVALILGWLYFKPSVAHLGPSRVHGFGGLEPALKRPRNPTRGRARDASEPTAGLPAPAQPGTMVLPDGQRVEGGDE